MSGAFLWLCALSSVSVGAGYLVGSSFYAPLWDPTILGYRVEARFDPSAGRDARQGYADKFGDRGRGLIRRLGTGEGPLQDASTRQQDADVKLYYST